MIDAANAPGLEPPDTFIPKAIVTTILDAKQKTGPLYLAVLAMEMLMVECEAMANEVTENRARRMHADGQLHDHELAVEATRVYAAVADGRRWHGAHYLTGPRAGQIDGPHLVPAHRRVDEDRDMPHARIIRGAVGLPF